MVQIRCIHRRHDEGLGAAVQGDARQGKLREVLFSYVQIVAGHLQVLFIFHPVFKLLPDMMDIISTWQSLSKKEKVEDDKKTKSQEHPEQTSKEIELPGNILIQIFFLKIFCKAIQITVN